MGLIDFFTGGGGSGGGGDPTALYPQGLFTPDQSQAIRQRGLLGFLGGMQKSGALDYTAPFLSGKVPGGFAAGVAGGAAGMGEAQNAAAQSALSGSLVGLQGQQLKAQIGLLGQLTQPAPPMYLQGGTPSVAGPSTAGPGPQGLLASGAAQGSASGGPLSVAQVKQLALDTGFSGDAADKATAIVMAESGGDPNAVGDGGKSFGLSQINAPSWGPIAASAKGNPAQAMKLMFNISNGGQDFGPWSTYKNGAYKKFLPTAASVQPIGANFQTGRAAEFGGGATQDAAPPTSAGGLQQPMSEAEYQRQYPNGILGPPGGFHTPQPDPVPTTAPAQGDNGRLYTPPPGLLAQNAPQAAPAPAGNLLPGPAPSAVPAVAQPQAPAAAPAAAMPPPGMAAGGAINPAYIQWAQHRAAIYTALGKPVPPDIAEAVKIPFAGPLAAAQAMGAVPAHNAETQFKTNEDIRKTNTLQPLEIQKAQAGPAMRGEQARQTQLQQAGFTFHPSIDPNSGLPTYVNSFGQAMPSAPGAGPVIAGEQNPFKESQQKEIDEAAQSAQSARSMRRTMDELVGEYQKVQDPGAGQDEIQNFRKHLQQFYQLAGIPVPEGLAKTTSGAEATNYLGLELISAAAKQMSPRAAQQIVQMIASVKPGIERTPQGMAKMQQLIHAATQEPIDRAQFVSQYYSPGGQGVLRKDAEAAFERANPTGLYSTMAQGSIPEPALRALVANPALRAQFDAKYGRGASGSVLGQ